MQLPWPFTVSSLDDQYPNVKYRYSNADQERIIQRAQLEYERNLEEEENLQLEEEEQRRREYLREVRLQRLEEQLQRQYQDKVEIEGDEGCCTETSITSQRSYHSGNIEKMHSERGGGGGIQRFTTQHVVSMSCCQAADKYRDSKWEYVFIIVNIACHCMALAITIHATVVYSSEDGETCQKVHGIFATFGYVLLMSFSIMVSSPFSLLTRDLSHEAATVIRYSLLLVAVVFIIISFACIVSVTSEGSHYVTTHGLIGLIAFLITIFSALIAVPAFILEHRRQLLSPLTHIISLMSYALGNFAVAHGVLIADIGIAIPVVITLAVLTFFVCVRPLYNIITESF